MMTNEQKVGVINYLLPESLVFICDRILFLISLLFEELFMVTCARMLFNVSLPFEALVDPFHPY